MTLGKSSGQLSSNLWEGMGEGWEPLILGGKGGYRRWKRKEREVGDIEGNFCNRLIFCKSKGVGTRNARYGRYGERVD